jgi:hypothetical protein
MDLDLAGAASALRGLIGSLDSSLQHGCLKLHTAQIYKPIATGASS